MLGILAGLGGFAIRYLPNLFSWLGDWFKAKQELSIQERMAVLTMKLEEKRAELAIKGMVINAEITEALASLQAEIAMMVKSLEDRKSAREFGAKLVSMMDRTLSRGKELGVPSWVISIGWCGVLSVEMLSAAIQPSIAVWAFGMWIHYRLTSDAVWTWQDMEILWAVVGFYLAGRVQKFEETKRVRTAVGG